MDLPSARFPIPFIAAICLYLMLLLVPLQELSSGLPWWFCTKESKSLHTEVFSKRGARQHELLSMSAPFVTDPLCPKFVVTRFANDRGFGHNMGALIFAAKMAKDINAAVVLPDGLYLSNPYVRQFFGCCSFLSYSELQLQQLSLTQWEAESRAAFYSKFINSHSNSTCNVAVTMYAATGHFCEGNWCFQQWPGVYNEMRPVFQQLHRNDQARMMFANYFTGHASNATHRNVVWHIRIGDIKLHADDAHFFSNIYSSLGRVSQEVGAVLTHFFVCGNKSQPTTASSEPPVGYGFLKKVAPGAIFVSSNKDDVDMYHFVKADILVGSGSSFPMIAAMFAPSNAIYLEPPPKESQKLFDEAWQTYHLNDSITVGSDGSMNATVIAYLVRRLRTQHDSSSLFE